MFLPQEIITIQQQRGWEETLEGDGCVYGLSGEDCIMGTHLRPNSELCTFNMYSSLHVNHTSIKGFIKKWRYLKYSEVWNIWAAKNYFKIGTFHEATPGPLFKQTALLQSQLEKLAFSINSSWHYVTESKPNITS